MNFYTGQALLEVCEKETISISEAMKRREMELGSISEEEIMTKLARAWEIMQNAATNPIKEPRKSIGGLLGGEAKKMNAFREAICADLCFPVHWLMPWQCWRSTLRWGLSWLHQLPEAPEYCLVCFYLIKK